MTVLSGLVRLPQGAERHFGKFTLVVKLGWGGMADVYLAKETGDAGDGSGAVLVVKRLKPDLAYDGEYRAMFKDESKLALRLDHPNIVRAHETGEIDGQPFLTMEFLNGQPLDKIFEAANERRLTRGEILHVVSALLSGMHYAHELKDEAGQPLDIVHRDVSPHNVFVTYDGRVKLVDFGIAKSRIKNNHTTTGVVKGKIAYMAPEQALASVVDKRADVFAAGVILWELMTGKPFWGDKSDVQILKTMTFGDLPSLDDALPNASPELRAICDKALSITPDQRYASAEEFREDIERFIDKVGERVTPDALGASIARFSVDRRRALEHVIDQQLGTAWRGGDATGDGGPPSGIRASRSSMTDGAPSVHDAPTAKIANASTSIDLADDASPISKRSGPSSVAEPNAPPSSHDGGGAAALNQTSDGQALPLVPIWQARTRSRAFWPWVAISGVTAAILLALGVKSLASSVPATSTSTGAAPNAAPTLPAPPATTTPPETAIASSAPPVASSSATDGDLIAVQISVAPADAKATLDGTALGSNPFSAKFKKDGVAHRLTVEAPGYTRKSELVVFDHDVDLTVTLDALGGRPGVVSQPPPHGTSKPGVGIIESDPWAKKNKPK